MLVFFSFAYRKKCNFFFHAKNILMAINISVMEETFACHFLSFLRQTISLQNWYLFLDWNESTYTIIYWVLFRAIFSAACIISWFSCVQPLQYSYFIPFLSGKIQDVDNCKSLILKIFLIFSNEKQCSGFQGNKMRYRIDSKAPRKTEMIDFHVIGNIIE